MLVSKIKLGNTTQSKALSKLAEKTAQMREMLKRPNEMAETILRKTTLETDWSKIAQAKATYAKATINK